MEKQNLGETLARKPHAHHSIFDTHLIIFQTMQKYTVKKYKFILFPHNASTKSHYGPW